MTMLTFFSLLISSLLYLGAPLFFGLFLKIRRKTPLLPFWVGALSYAAAQILFLLFLQLLFSWKSIEGVLQNPWIYAAIYGTSAGIFQESVRFLMRKTLLRRHGSYREGISFGAGCGGLQAFFLSGVATIITLASFLQQMLGNEPSISFLLPSDLLPVWQQAFQEVSLLPILLSLTEQIFLFLIQMALSLFVFAAAAKYRKLFLPFLISVFFHLFIDGGFYLIAAFFGESPYLPLLYLAILSGIGLWFFFFSKRFFSSKPA